MGGGEEDKEDDDDDEEEVVGESGIGSGLGVMLNQYSGGLCSIMTHFLDDEALVLILLRSIFS